MWPSPTALRRNWPCQPPAKAVPGQACKDAVQLHMLADLNVIDISLQRGDRPQGLLAQ